jgi:SulP family sulfate permease
MSQTVVVGFTVGAALLIIGAQVPAALGTTGASQPAGVGDRGLTDPSAWNPAAAVIAIAVIGVVQVARRIHPLVPGALIALIGATVVASLAGYSGPTLARSRWTTCSRSTSISTPSRGSSCRPW